MPSASAPGETLTEKQAFREFFAQSMRGEDKTTKASKPQTWPVLS